MKLLFVHGHKFRKIDGNIYSTGGLNNKVLSWYADMFGQVTVNARILEEDTTNSNYDLIKNPHVHVVANRDMDQMIQTSDAIIIRLPSINGYKAARLAKKRKKPYLVEVVGCIWDACLNHSMKGKLFALPAMLIMRQRVKHAPYTIYVTKKFLQKRYPTNGKNTGVSDVRLTNTDISVLERRTEKIENVKSKLVLGTIGSVDVRHKGQENVIRALKKLAETLPCKVEYQIVGGGNAARLRQIAKECGVEENVKLLGVKDHADLFLWLDSIDMYIQPSFQEGLCRALAEAMSRGLPCIASNVGGNPELVEKQWLVSVKRKHQIPSRIAEAVTRLADKKTMQEQAVRNFEFIKENFDNKKLEEERTAFYREFIENAVHISEK